MSRPPVLGYLVLTALWLAAITLLWKLERFTELGGFEFVLLAFATYELSRITTAERIGYPIRRLFTEINGETPRSGWARAPGQLVTCPYCASVWSATLLLAAHVDVATVILALAGAASLGHAWRAKQE